MFVYSQYFVSALSDMEVVIKMKQLLNSHKTQQFLCKYSGKILAISEVQEN